MSTFYFEGNTPDLAGLYDFFNVIRGNIPNQITITIEPTGQTIDPATGLANGNWSSAPPAAVVGTGGLNYSAVAGGYISWRTGAFLGGREQRGKTFLVPLAAGVWDSNGDINATSLGQLQAAANTFAGLANGFSVYSRKGAGFAGVTSAKAVDKAVVLRTRRP